MKRQVKLLRLLLIVVTDLVIRLFRTQVPFLLSFMRYLVTNSRLDNDSTPSVIISMTSYPARYKYLRKTLISLLSQKSRVNYLIQVNLWSDDYRQLPENILKMQSPRLRFVEVQENLRVYLKLIPTMKMVRDIPIITADDDIYYKSSWLMTLFEAHLVDPSVAIGFRACKIGFSDLIHRVQYQDWERVSEPTGPSSEIFLTGVGGILYPPSWFSIAELDISLPLHLSPTNDDLWFYFLARSKGKSFEKIHKLEFEPTYWPGSQRTALWKKNVSEKENDIYVKNLLDFFKY